MDGSKMVQKENWTDKDKEKEATIVHEIKGDEWTAVKMKL